MNYLKTYGKLIFDPKDYTRKHEKQSKWKKTAMVLIGDDLSEYYAWFLKKRFNLKLNPPLRDSHLTIVNDRVSDSTDNMCRWDELKEFYKKEVIEVEYHVSPRTNGEHWWLTAACREGVFIREQLGLKRTPYFGMHITIGHANEKFIDHSEYIYRQILRHGI